MLQFGGEYDLYNDNIPTALRNALVELRRPDNRITRLEVTVVQRAWGRQLRIEGHGGEE